MSSSSSPIMSSMMSSPSLLPQCLVLSSPTSTSNNNITIKQSKRDKRPNRKRVSCGFHHKRHQACPENCEGRVSHPPESHKPIQDKFTVGCTECKAHFNKQQPQLHLPYPPTKSITSSSSSQQSQQTSMLHLGRSSSITSLESKVRNARFVLPELLESKHTTSDDSSSPSSSRPISPLSSSDEVPTFSQSQAQRNISLNLMSVQSRLEHDQNKNKRKRKSMEPPSSPEFYSDDSANSSPINSIVPSPSMSPESTPRMTVSSPLQQSASYSASSVIDSSLLLCLEQEVEKEIFSHNEQELVNKKRLQQEELDKVTRQQRLLDLQKDQQREDAKRLKRRQEELEQWRITLDQKEKELETREDSLSRRSDLFSISNKQYQTSTSFSRLPKLQISSNLLSHVSNELLNSDPITPATPMSQPFKLNSLSISMDRSPIVPDTSDKFPMSFTHLLNSQSSN
ncbi:hypothetical protein SAMD00019534_046720 [Acytostelium subglobosum LB1]|uniref:hypothetical protein n=1 Tax=Acytostelium subglobosum LB1 TaxID=1410327 RepID=UPI000644A09A|nr:hypothetical protein SAMD00019534_046720 [Acytostelium subglobosum LB1]GAM21497.1 hypothetical protein SAMD00019534_046720 [Acytostelium subglobosum LB1]|eukprot:XP_012755616.1 hypothetical protein SAMD00019534_046720 [Acytostelium subglobosum LB1]